LLPEGKQVRLTCHASQDAVMGIRIARVPTGSALTGVTDAFDLFVAAGGNRMT